MFRLSNFYPGPVYAVEFEEDDQEMWDDIKERSKEEPVMIVRSIEDAEKLVGIDRIEVIETE